MQVSFTINPVDAIAFWEYCDHHVPQLKRAFLVRRLVRPVVWVFALTLGLLVSRVLIRGNNELSDIPFVLFFGALCVAIYVAVYPTWRAYSLRRAVDKALESEAQYAAVPIVYTITHDGFHVKHALVDGTLSWTAVRNVVVTEKHIFVFYQDDNAYVIPAAAFSNTEHRQSFVQELMHYYSGPRTTA